MDAELAKPFIKAAVDVLSTMAFIQPKPGAPYLKTDKTAVGDVTGLIGLSGDKSGSLSITFTRPLAVAVVRNMLGDDIDDVLQDVKDATGEMVNMISGQARAGLSEQGVKCDGGTPCVLFGDGHAIDHPGGAKVMAVPFTADQGEFTLEFCLG